MHGDAEVWRGYKLCWFVKASQQVLIACLRATARTTCINSQIIGHTAVVITQKAHMQMDVGHLAPTCSANNAGNLLLSCLGIANPLPSTFRLLHALAENVPWHVGSWQFVKGRCIIGSCYFSALEGSGLQYHLPTVHCCVRRFTSAAVNECPC